MVLFYNYHGKMGPDIGNCQGPYSKQKAVHQGTEWKHACVETVTEHRGSKAKEIKQQNLCLGTATMLEKLKEVRILRLLQRAGSLSMQHSGPNIQIFRLECTLTGPNIDSPLCMKAH